jgi:hypothetical protein
MEKLRSTHAQIKKLAWESLDDPLPDQKVATIQSHRDLGMTISLKTCAIFCPIDCFAEVSSHFLVEANFLTYMNQEFVKWFQRHFFHDQSSNVEQKNIKAFAKHQT